MDNFYSIIIPEKAGLDIEHPCMDRLIKHNFSSEESYFYLIVFRIMNQEQGPHFVKSLINCLAYLQSITSSLNQKTGKLTIVQDKETKSIVLSLNNFISEATDKDYYNQNKLFMEYYENGAFNKKRNTRGS
jgi:hypothetical protein